MKSQSRMTYKLDKVQLERTDVKSVEATFEEEIHKRLRKLKTGVFSDKKVKIREN